MNSEKRINKLILNYWQNLQEQYGHIPKESNIKPNDITDIWQNCFVINISNGKYNFLGKNIVDLGEGKSIIGKNIYENLICPQNSNIISIAKEVVNTKTPISHESQIANQYGDPVKYRRCLVPLSDNNNDITHVLGGVRWKIT